MASAESSTTKKKKCYHRNRSAWLLVCEALAWLLVCEALSYYLLVYVALSYI
jgi:hypothetical protein